MSVQSAMANDVLIVGAGFSKAVNSLLPSANELGQLAYRAAERAAPGLFDGLHRPSEQFPFESWLSLLFEDQPHLRESENRQNAAQFARLTDALVSVLNGLQQDALQSDAPPWFYDLLSVLHETCGHVVSLNYDTLVEVGVNSTFLRLHDATYVALPPPSVIPDAFSTPSFLAPHISPDDILRGIPPHIASIPLIERPHPPTMRLLKLHGSLDWWAVPGDEIGATLVRDGLLSRFCSPQPMSEEERNLALPGRETFIIPPLTSKSPYYRNPIARQLWRDASNALGRARRIVLLGYSLPAADIMIAGMLQRALRASDAEVVIVDIAPGPVVERLAALIDGSVPPRNPVVFDGLDCVQQFVTDFTARRAEEVVPAVTQLRPREYPGTRDAAYVRWSKQGMPIDEPISALAVQDGALVVQVRAGPVPPPQEWPTTGEVIRASDGVRRIIVESANGQFAPVVGMEADAFSDPNARHTLWLRAAGQKLSD